MGRVGSLYQSDGMWNLILLEDVHNPIKGTLIEVFEQFITYLLNNNLLTK